MILLALTLALAGMAYMSNGRGGNHKQVITAAGLAAGDQGAGHSAHPGETVPASPAASPDGCLSSVKAITYYRKAYTASRTAMNLAGAVPRVWYQRCPVIKRRAVEWRNRSSAARRALATWTTHHYAWWEWMPRGSKWYRVASCETGYGRDPNFSHDSGTYVSAFGIFRPGYADDAHRVGNLSWDETVRTLGRLPTPREQYEAALSHYRAHGGFSGWGCRGA